MWNSPSVLRIGLNFPELYHEPHLSCEVAILGYFAIEDDTYEPVRSRLNIAEHFVVVADLLEKCCIRRSVLATTPTWKSHPGIITHVYLLRGRDDSLSVVAARSAWLAGHAHHVREGGSHALNSRGRRQRDRNDPVYQYIVMP